MGSLIPPAFKRINQTKDVEIEIKMCCCFFFDVVGFLFIWLGFFWGGVVLFGGFFFVLFENDILT